MKTSPLLFIRLACMLMALSLAGCQTGTRNEPGSLSSSSLSVNDVWQLGSLANTSYTRGAADAVTTLLEAQLRGHHLLNEIQPVNAVRYEVEGSVTQWHYIGNASPRPVVAVQLRITDRRSQQVVWTDSGRKVGLRGQTLTAVADGLLEKLTNRIPLDESEGARTKPGATVASQMIGAESSIASAGTSALGLRGDPSNRIKRQAQVPSSLLGRATAFFYGSDPAIDILSQYDRLVLEPDNINDDDLTRLKAKGARTYAYLSIGEVGPFRAYAKDIKESWIIGKNSAWDSLVLDLSNSELRQFLLERVNALQLAGYQGLFLDTMDSFNIAAETDQQKESQRAGLIQLINSISEQYPQLRIITNRGFEVLDDIAQHVEAVAAESLYASWNNTTQMYTAVPENDRAWLLGKLDHAKNALNLDVIAIDYLPPERRAEAREIALRIAERGFIPWIANPGLDYLGVGALDVIPRKVLMLYDSTVDGTLRDSPVHQFIATPVEYLGYVPEYLDVATQTLPAGILTGRYAGVVTFSNQEYEVDALGPWIQKRLDERLPVVFVGVPPVTVNEKMMVSMGIRPTASFDISSASVSLTDDLIKPERTLSKRLDSMALSARSTSSDNTAHMSYKDASSSQVDVVITGPFGGFALQPGAVDNALDNESYWIIEPVNFLRTALQLPNAPMPDVTTENGKRLWLSHIDGDALPSWAEMPGKRLGAEVIYDEILVPYKLPHSVSVVEGEITDPAYKDRRDEMYAVARKIFALNSVEIASHTYSHPFVWSRLATYRKSGRFNLKIPGYEYSPERETAGSMAFINRELAPAGKQTKLMLWSGDALPDIVAISIVDEMGIANMNGGLTHATNSSHSLTMVSPMARPVGEYVQVYAPITNENIYTNEWKGPYDGFRRAIETFELTDKPRRIKPVNVYYHFYSGTKIASMRALKSVYDWSMNQDIYPLFGSEYSIKVPDFQNAGVARYLDGAWKLSGLGNIRSIRLLDNLIWPDLDKSQGIVGARALHDGNYMHTNGADQIVLYTRNSPPSQVYLVSSNGQVLQWDDSGNGLSFRVAGTVPVSVELAGNIARTCTVSTGDQLIKGVVSKEKTITFTFSKKDTGNAYLSCPA